MVVHAAAVHLRDRHHAVGIAEAVAITAAGGVVVVAGIAVLVGAIAAARDARTYDAAVLRVLGATRG